MKYWIMALFCLSLSACATSRGNDASVSTVSSSSGKTVKSLHTQPDLDHPDVTPFVKTANGKADLAAAMDRARTEDKYGLVVMGANWCHDSRALAGHFQTQRFQTLLDENYALVYIDIGNKDKNLDVAKSLGLETIEGTPSVIVTDASGKVLNLEDAPTWRNAASRDGDDIYAYFEAYTN